jgi:replicative DNA helicase
VPLRDLVQSSFTTIERLQQHKGAVTGIPSGFADLDQLTAGFQRGDLVIVAARPSMGKTSFALNVAQHVGTATDMTVGFFSLEMSKEQLFMRLLTAEARIDGHRFRTGHLSEKDYGRLSHALGTLAEARVFIDDSASIGVLEMRAKARRLMSTHRLDLLIIDYLQLMQGRGRFENRQQEVSAISRSLKGLAKELNIPVIALSQLSRAPESRGDHKPQLSDLRESGALEQDADVVLFIYRPEVYDRDRTRPEDEGVAEIIIGKQRNGPIDTVKLSFLSPYTRFENYSPLS